MAGPIPEIALDQLDAIEHEELSHTIQLESQETVRVPDSGGEYETTWVAEPEQPCYLKPARAGGLNLRADKATPIGDFELWIELGQQILEGQRGMVRGVYRDGSAWQRWVTVTKAVVPMEGLGLALCTLYADPELV